VLRAFANETQETRQADIEMARRRAQVLLLAPGIGFEIGEQALGVAEGGGAADADGGACALRARASGKDDVAVRGLARWPLANRGSPVQPGIVIAPLSHKGAA
jgi:hypothetical protein